MILETDAGTMSRTRKLIILVSKINVPIQAIFKSETTYYIIWTRRLEQGQKHLFATLSLMPPTRQSNVFDLVQVYVSIQSSGKPIEHFLADDQFSHLSRHFNV